ncbi:glycosyltransferase family 39 protein [Candidatus Woesearchaeota archaeon]|nr:glycosyltransferase family 39 protein [Candidatus Woesearchaeota archaeon]
MDNKTKYWLLGIFLLTLTVRLLLAFLIPNFTYESYFHLRQVQHITETGLPLYHDFLSYGGRELVFLPFFHYFMSFFDLLLPLELAAKLIPNILMALLTVIIYFISKKITNHDTSSLISAFIAGFLPVLATPNNFVPETLFLPLIFFTIYSFLNLSEKKYLYLYLTSFILLSLTSSAAFLMLMGFGIYLLLSFLEERQIKPEEKEVMLFSLFMFIWLQFLFFKKVLITYGISFIWQNIPPAILLEYFPHLSIPSAIVLVSVIPFLAGIWVVYQSLFQVKSRKMFLLISLVIATTILAWFRLLRFNLSLSFFGITLAILFALFYQDLAMYIEKTKLSSLKKCLLPLTLILLTLTIVPLTIGTALKQSTPSTKELAAFAWLKDNSPPDAGILSTLKEGHLVTYYSQRRNLMDDQFTLISNIEARFNDLNHAYITKFQTQALSVFDKYKINYLVLTPAAQLKYDLPGFNYLGESCFKTQYDEETKIYHVECALTSPLGDEK